MKSGEKKKVKGFYDMTHEEPLVNVTEHKGPTLTLKNELNSCDTKSWYVQCDIIYFFFKHIQSV